MAERRFQLINKRYRDGETLCFGADADFCINFDGTDINFVGGSGLTDLNLTGVTAINAGTVDADFDAITGTSYGGITEANLLDKTAAETITEDYTFSGTGKGLFIDGGLAGAGTFLGWKSDGHAINQVLIDDHLDMLASSGTPTSYRLRDGMDFRVYDSTDVNYLKMVHDGTDSYLEADATTRAIVFGEVDSDQKRVMILDRINVLTDDATGTFVVPDTRTRGFIFLSTGSFNHEAVIISILNGTLLEVWNGGNFDIGQTTNPDTDGKMNIWIADTGTISIKNRRGSNRSVNCFLMNA